MLAENILQQIGFTSSELEEYEAYRALIGPQAAAIADAYMQGKIPYSQALEEVHNLAGDNVPEPAAKLLFYLECTGPLRDRYDAAGIGREIFYDTMRDTRYKLDECRRVYGVFGITPIGWYEEFLTMQRFAFGRLQFDITTYRRESTTVCGYPLNEGDFVLNCHIPSSGPLTPESCMDAYRRAYAFFADRLRDRILPITCNSWLLYPDHYDIFGDNTRKFIDSYALISTKQSEQFNNAWRIFYRSDIENLDQFPTDTSLQRRFIDYIRAGGSFGSGFGVLLFDGERILTQKHPVSEDK